MVEFFISAAMSICIYFFFAILDGLIQEKRAIASGIEDIDRLTGREFKIILSDHFSKLGYHVRQDSAARYHGVDLILLKGSSTTFVQAKRWKKPVGVKPVQEVLYAARRHNADRGLVITNSRFTGPAYTFARSNGVELWDRRKLVDFILKVRDAK